MVVTEEHTEMVGMKVSVPMEREAAARTGGAQKWKAVTPLWKEEVSCAPCEISLQAALPGGVCATLTSALCQNAAVGILQSRWTQALPLAMLHQDCNESGFLLSCSVTADFPLPQTVCT